MRQLKKKKILFINGHLDTGGVENSLVTILRHIDYSRYDVDLLLTERLGDYYFQLPDQVNVILRSIENSYGPFGTVMLRGLINRDWFSLRYRLVSALSRVMGHSVFSLLKKDFTGGKKYDCAVGFRRGLCTQLAVNAVDSKYRITWWHHGSVNVNTESYLNEVEKCDRIVAVSNACKAMLVNTMPLLQDRMVVIYNLVDINAIRAKADLGVPYECGNCLNIVSVGGLVPEKHFENAIYAASELKKRGVAFKWHLVGDGVLREALHELVEKLNVSDCFVFEGNQPNPYPYVKWADLFVHTSYVESFGLVVAEALVLGLPCVVTKSSGVLEFLQDGDNALLTDQSPEALTEKVIYAVENGAIRDRLRHNTRCPEQFMPSAVIREIEDLLERRL